MQNELPTLCGACGLCCDGSLFGRVPLAPDEATPARRLRLRVLPTGARSRSRAPRSRPASPAPMRAPRPPRPWSRCASAQSTRSGRARARRSRAGSTRATGARGARSSRGWRPCDACASWSLSSTQRESLQPISTEMPPQSARGEQRARAWSRPSESCRVDSRKLRTSGRRLRRAVPRARSSAASLALASKLRPLRARRRRNLAMGTLQHSTNGDARKPHPVRKPAALRALAGGADVAMGKAMRGKCPRSSHAVWRAPPRPTRIRSG